MLSDGHVRRSLKYVIDPVIAGVWDFEPADKSSLSKEIADFCRYAFYERMNWSGTVRKIMRGYMANGFQLLEPVEKVERLPSGRFKRHPGGGSAVVFDGWKDRPANTIERWIQHPEHTDCLSAVDQWISGSDEEEAGYRMIPADRLLRFTREQEGSNFAGFPDLRGAYGPWKVKLILTVLESIRHERCGVGMPMMKEPENASDEDREIAETILSELRSHEKGYILLPFGYEFSWSKVDGSGTNIAETIERCNRDIAYNTGFAHMLMGVQGKTGSYSLAETHDGQAGLGVEAHAKFVTDTINLGTDGWSAVRRMVAVNYGLQAANENCPRQVVRSLPVRDTLNLLGKLPPLIDSGAVRVDGNLRRTVRESMRIPAEDPDTLDMDSPTRRFIKGEGLLDHEGKENAA